jgi:hypothetical protein
MHHFLPIMFKLNRKAQTVCTHYECRNLYATSGLNPRWVYGNFLRLFPSGHAMELESTQPLTEMYTRDTHGVKVAGVRVGPQRHSIFIKK